MAVTKAESPAKQLAGFLSPYSPEIVRVTRGARSRLRKLMPTAVELVYDNYNGLVIGYGPSEKASEAIFSLTLYQRWVSLFFLQGAVLSDPDRLLKGSGNVVRHVVLEQAADLDGAKLRRLMKAAIASAKVPLPKTGRTYTVIKSVSKKQRARRPE